MKNETLAHTLKQKLVAIGIKSDVATSLLSSMQVETEIANEDYLEFLGGRLTNCEPQQRADFQERFDGLTSIKGQEYHSVMLRDREGLVSYLAGVDKNGGRIIYFIATNAPEM